MSKFDGHVRDLGEIPPDLLTALVDKVSSSAQLWLVNDPRFLTAHPDSRLTDLYRDEINRLEKLIGLDLSMWRQEHMCSTGWADKYPQKGE